MIGHRLKDDRHFLNIPADDRSGILTGDIHMLVLSSIHIKSNFYSGYSTIYYHRNHTFIENDANKIYLFSKNNVCHYVYIYMVA